MSRYLDYSNPGARLDQLIEIDDHPKRVAWIVIAGPSEPFREYVTSKDYLGSSTIWGGGRFVVGQPINTFTTLAVTLLPGIYYYNAVLPKYPPSDGDTSFLVISQSILAGIIFVSFFFAAFMNPGILPRGTRVPSELEDHLDSLRVPHSRFLRMRDETVKQRFCTTCFNFRPPRSKHCSFCDNCVLRFDHHCTWLGNCVGLHNYRFFVCLIFSSTLFLIECIYVGICILVKTAESDSLQKMIVEVSFDTIGEFSMQIVFLGYCLFLMVALLLLSLYHAMICSRNLTTNEHVKNYYRTNPFDSGIVRNWRHIWCHSERVFADGKDRFEVTYKAVSFWEGYSFDD